MTYEEEAVQEESLQEESGGAESDDSSPQRDGPPARPADPADFSRRETPARGGLPAELFSRAQAAAAQLEVLVPADPVRVSEQEIAVTVTRIQQIWAARQLDPGAFGRLLDIALRETGHAPRRRPVGYFLSILRTRCLAPTVDGGREAEVVRGTPAPDSTAAAAPGTALAGTVTGVARMWRVADDLTPYVAQVQALWRARPDLSEAAVAAQIRALVARAGPVAAGAGAVHLEHLVQALAAALAPPPPPGA